jgi:hypothetical protein
MSPDVEQSSGVEASPRARAEDRRRRQTLTFLGLFGFVALVGFIALGNWLEWWTIGGRPHSVTIICPAQSVTDPALTKVNVYNTTARFGLASAVAKELRTRNFSVLSVGNQPQSKPIQVIAIIRYGPPGKAAATTVARQFPGKVQMTQDSRDNRTVDVVLGQRYKGMQVRAKAAAAIKPKPMPDGCIVPTEVSSSEPEPS